MNPGKIIMCNWKANMSSLQIERFFTDLHNANNNNIYNNLFVFPSFLHILSCIDLKNKYNLSSISIGSQDVSEFNNGAYTSAVTAEMLSDSGVRYSLIGHSERRNIFGDDNNKILQKLLQCSKHKINPVICIGESFAELESGLFENVIQTQLSILHQCETQKDIIVAYEPVWAIGTGKIPSAKDIEEKHKFIKNFVKNKYGKVCKVLYGGSVNETNYEQILQISSVDGILVGGASMKPENVIKFCR